jgi:hypothetical protein
MLGVVVDLVRCWPPVPPLAQTGTITGREAGHATGDGVDFSLSADQRELPARLESSSPAYG